MVNRSNKDVVKRMYQIILNQKEFEMISQFVDSNYIETFNSSNKPLMHAFPDIQFTIQEIFEEDNKVITLYNWTGTHLNKYQDIPATNKKITVEGMSIYELENGKIFNSSARPDKLSFFLQLGIVPADFMHRKVLKEDLVYFVDEFEIPQQSYEQFKERLDYNRKFIKKLNGFVQDQVIKKNGEANNVIIMTIAIWENEQSLTNAKKAVQAEYKRINFNPTVFNEKLNIKMKRDTYFSLD